MLWSVVRRDEDAEEPRATAEAPAASLRFYGRALDVVAIEKLFARGETLVTLVGPGGIGKTTLARRYLEEAKHARSSGAWFCDLVDVDSQGALCATVATALGIDAAQKTDVAWVRQLGLALELRGEALLVLDNCEQAIAVVAETVSAWSALAPRIRWLLTSREPLHASRECVHALPGLELPSDAASLMESSAAQMFVARAMASFPAYHLHPSDSEAIVEILRALDGLPLAIELAAARIGLLGASELRARLSTPFATLGQGPRDAPLRQKTLDRTIAWSWELLSPIEQAALRRSAVFRGGFSLIAAEAVLGAEAVISVLHALCDKSMLRAQQTERGARFVHYEMIRWFAATKLDEAGETTLIAQRHARHYLEPAEAWSHSSDPGLPRFELAEAAQDERENLLAVYRHAIEKAASTGDDGRDALLATIALAPVVATPAEQLSVATRALQLAEGCLGSREHCWAQLACLERKETAGDAELPGLLAVTLEHQRALAPWVYNLLAFQAVQRGDLELASQYNLEGKELAVELSVVKSRVWIENNLADNELSLGRTEQAYARVSEALARAKTIAGLFGTVSVALCLTTLGEVLLERGSVASAVRSVEEAFALLEGSSRVRARIGGALARTYHEVGDLPRARSIYELTSRLEREVGIEPYYESFHRASLGALLAECDDGVSAERALDEAETIARANDATPALQILSFHRGHLELFRARRAVARLQPAEAERWLAAAHARAPERLDTPSLDERFARRLLLRALRGAIAGLQSVVRVSRDGARCVMPDGTEVDLQRRPRLIPILLALTEARVSSPGKPTELAELFAVAWPSESARFESMRNRIYVAINTLRELGLRAVLLHRPEGYLLDPETPIAWATDA